MQETKAYFYNRQRQTKVLGEDRFSLKQDGFLDNVYELIEREELPQTGNEVESAKDPHSKSEAKILTQYTEEERAKIRQLEKAFNRHYYWNEYVPSWLRLSIYIIAIITFLWCSLHFVINLAATDKYVSQAMVEATSIELNSVSCQGEGKYDISFLLDIPGKGEPEHLNLRVIKNVGIIQFGSIITLKDIVPIQDGHSYIQIKNGGSSVLNGFLRKVNITLYICQ